MAYRHITVWIISSTVFTQLSTCQDNLGSITHSQMDQTVNGFIVDRWYTLRRRDEDLPNEQKFAVDYYEKYLHKLLDPISFTKILEVFN